MSAAGMDKTIPNPKLTAGALNKLKKGQVYNANLDTKKIFSLDGVHLDREYKDGDYIYTDEAREIVLENDSYELKMIDYNKKVGDLVVKRIEVALYNPYSVNAGQQDPDGNSIIRLIMRGQKSQGEGLIADRLGGLL